MKTNLAVLSFLTIFLSGCSPEPGSEKWCKKLLKKPPLEWTVEENMVAATDCLKYLQE